MRATIQYKVQGQGDLVFKAGPYVGEKEIQYQYGDIRTYEGVYDCKIVYAPSPGELERLLIPYEQWHTVEAPAEAVALAEREYAQGVPTGIAKHPEQGWFVLQSSGQGPYIIWQE